MLRRALLLMPLLLGLSAQAADAQTRLRVGSDESAPAASLGPESLSAASLGQDQFSYTAAPLVSGTTWQDKFMSRSLGAIEAEILRGSNFAAGVTARPERQSPFDLPGRIESPAEVGAFGELSIDSWSIIGRVGQDVSDEGGGFFADFGVKWASQFGDALRVEVGSGVSWSSAGHFERSFGVGSPGAGLRLYDATPGVRDVTISGSVSYALTDNWTIGGLVGAQRFLGSSAASSQLREDREFFGGVSLDYRF